MEFLYRARSVCIKRSADTSERSLACPVVNAERSTTGIRAQQRPPDLVKGESPVVSRLAGLLLGSESFSVQICVRIIFVS